MISRIRSCTIGPFCVAISLLHIVTNMAIVDSCCNYDMRKKYVEKKKGVKMNRQKIKEYYNRLKKRIFVAQVIKNSDKENIIENRNGGKPDERGNH
ncbi:hypothetical protein [Pilibacter termitis]|nr:hypothetical protein [Pilibacter termitis]